MFSHRNPINIKTNTPHHICIVTCGWYSHSCMVSHQIQALLCSCSPVLIELVTWPQGWWMWFMLSVVFPLRWNANNVCCLGWRESITLTVSHVCPLGETTHAGESDELRWRKRKEECEQERPACTFCRNSVCAMKLGHSRHVSPRLQCRQAKLT